MLMPKSHRMKIYEYLFKEGVLVAKKDFHADRHPDKELEKIPNLHVIKAMQSLKSKGYVKEQFAWRHYYWYLTNDGIQHLRVVLNLPSEIIPATLKRQARPEATRQRTRAPAEGDRSKPSAGDREGYRWAPGEPDKKGDAGIGADTKLEFKGGFGRGRSIQ